MNDFELAKQKGVSSPYAKGFMPYTDMGNNTYKVDYDLAARKLVAMDAAMTTSANVGIPSAYVTWLDPQIMPILFAVMNSTKLAPETKKGTWIDQSMQFPVEEYTGSVTPYSDYTENTTADINVEFPERQNFLFQVGLKYGDREAEVANRAKIAFASEKQKAAAYTISNAMNRFYLYGVKGKRIYGLLNDPNLNSTETPISITISGQNYSTWTDKQTYGGDNFVNYVYNDVNKVFTSIMSKNGGHVDQNTKLILAISNTRYSLLNVPNQFGKTPLAMLKENFPNMEVVLLPQLSTSAGEMLYMIVPELEGAATAECAYSEKFRLSRVEQKMTHFKQKALAGTWGCIIKRPSCIATMTGI